MLSKVADLLQVAKYGVRREVAHRHVVDHPLAQGGNLAGGQDGVVNRCRVAHDEQQYRTSRRLTYSYWIWLKKKVVATEIPRSGLVQVIRIDRKCSGDECSGERQKACAGALRIISLEGSHFPDYGD